MSSDDARKTIAELKSQSRALGDLIEKAAALRGQVEAHLTALRQAGERAEHAGPDRRSAKSERRKTTRHERRK